jgi:CheY-like chemotaxis protein
LEDRVINIDWDLFISHASEDKESFVRPLASALMQKGLKVWYDEHTLQVGDSIRRSIERGLKYSKYGLVIISPDFLEKEWPQKELDYLFAAETDLGYKILPVWHNITFPEVRDKLPLISDRFATRSSLGIDRVVSDIIRSIKSKNKYDGISGRLVTNPNTEQMSMEVVEMSQLTQNLYDLLLSSSHEISGDLINRRVLIADDDSHIVEMIKDFLINEGFNAATVGDGLEALDQLKKGSFDIVITDIVMPRMSGYELTKIVSENYPDIFIILMSGFRSGVEDDFVKLSHVAFFQKPFRFNDFLDTVFRFAYHNPLYQFSKATFSDCNRTYRTLLSCHSLIHRFLKMYQSNNLFETAIRHKIKDSVRDFCNYISTDSSNSFSLSCQLLSRLKRLENLMKQIKHGSETGLTKMLEGIKEDIESENPGISVSLSIMTRLPTFIAGRDIETFLALCALEFTDNAIDAIQKSGKISISLRRKQTSNSIALNVWNNGPIISEDLAGRIFDDAVTTKGPGRGIGLNIIKNLCDRFGGTIKLAQNPGVQFIVLLPLDTAV